MALLNGIKAALALWVVVCALAGAAFGDYCSASGEDYFYEYIKYVEVWTIKNSTAGSNYSDYTELSTELYIDYGYLITVTNGDAYSGDQCGVWVDWNGDEDFEDANEAILMSGGPETFTGTITPPEGSTEGATRMRVRIMDTGVLSPCGTTEYGEVEDYTLIVTEYVSPGYGGGSGTVGEPYLIYTAEQINMIGVGYLDWDKHFRLMADIDMSGYTGESYNIIGSHAIAFSGVFDGGGHTIFNFTYSDVNKVDVGLFGFIKGPDARVENLCLNDPCIIVENGWRVGALAGCLKQGSISGCRLQNGSVYGHYYVGGLVGAVGGLSTLTYECVITECHSIGDVQGNYCCGGLAGSMQRRGYLTNSHAEGHVEGISNIGGLLGEAYSAQSVENCYYNGRVSGDDNIAGLIGRNYHTLTKNCYAMGIVEGIGAESGGGIGGLVGYNNSEGIVYCYSTCVVSGNANVGGLVGTNNGTVEHSYWDVQTSNQEISAGGTGKTTVEMKTGGTYFAWGCEPWTINQYVDYPRLIWENLPGQRLEGLIYGGGSGEPNDPYVISTAAHFRAIGFNACDWDKHFKLMADIDLSEFTGDSFNIIGHWINRDISVPFVGTFDGNGRTISNFTYDSNSLIPGHGLFGAVSGCVKNLGLINIHVSGLSLGTGGLIGTFSGTMMNCYSTGSVLGDSGVGGLVGTGFGGNIQECFSTCEVTGYHGVGGLVGYNKDYHINISDCYSTGRVMGDSGVGGLVGYFDFGDISRCYSTGAVDGNDYVGGVIGYDYGETYANCFWDVNVNPDVNGIGNADEPNVVGLPTADMQMESTFTDAGWDFVDEAANGPNDIWDICEGTNYPKFVWQIQEGDFVCPDGVNFIDYSFFAGHWGETDYGDVDGVELTGDGRVNWEDFGVFAGWWMVSGCGNCGGADLTGEGDVDYADLDVFTGYWLESEYGDCGGAELTGDGAVGADDLREFSDNWLGGI